MSKLDIFLSYSREDRTAARYFAECFKNEGLSVWWDAALHSGETFDEVIEAELKAAKAVVVLWSPRSVASRWVRAEVTMADRRKKLVPAIIEPCDRPIIFELTHTTDLSDWTGDTSDSAWQSFLRDIRRLVDRADAAATVALADASEGRNRVPAPSPAHRFSKHLANADERSSAMPRPVQAASTRSRPPFAVSSPPPAQSEDYGNAATQICARLEHLEIFVADEYHCLEVTSAGKLEQRYVVSPLGLKIGRSAPADLILSDARVSRTHCIVELADDRLRVSDLNSTNGTFIDGKRIEGSCFLAIGSILKVGDVSFKHKLRSRTEF